MPGQMSLRKMNAPTARVRTSVSFGHFCETACFIVPQIYRTVGGQWMALANITSTTSSNRFSRFSALEQASVGESNLAGFSSQEV